MSKIIPELQDLIGHWVLENKKVVGDATCRRVHDLYKTYLEVVGKADGGWSDLCRDPEDGRLWEYTYLESHMHGGGPPSLILMTAEVAEKKYGFRTRA